MFARLAAVVICIAWFSWAYADYLEVHRNAYVYQESNRHSQQLDHITHFSQPVNLRLAQNNLENGYYRVWLRQGTGTGWIYKSRVRLRSGDPPGAPPGTDEEIMPDIEPAPSVMPWPDNFDASAITNPALEIYVFSIGQADSMLVIGPPPQNRTLLVDIGEQLTGPKDNHIYVRQRIEQITGSANIDYLVISHFHTDHIGGPGRGPCTSRGNPSGIFALLAIQANPFTVGTLIDRGDAGQNFTPNRSTPHCGVLAHVGDWLSRGVVGQRISPSFGNTDINLGTGVDVEVLATDGRVSNVDAGAMAHASNLHPNLYNQNAQASENDYSVALEISLGDFELFTGGDLTGSAPGHENETHLRRQFGSNAQIYTNVESHMVRHWRSIGRESDVEVYRVNHHGSAHSSNNDLLNALQPEIAIYSTGGAYGHPADTTSGRLDYADQYVTTDVSDGTWPNGFPSNFGDIVGEIHISVSTDGSRYQLNEWIYPSYSDTAEAQ